jgi:tetratricopeptide (TPR) repeat protein
LTRHDGLASAWVVRQQKPRLAAHLHVDGLDLMREGTDAGQADCGLAVMRVGQPDPSGLDQQSDFQTFAFASAMKAATQFRRAIELTPENVRGYTNLDGVYYVKGKFQQAQELFEKSDQRSADRRWPRCSAKAVPPAR